MGATWCANPIVQPAEMVFKGIILKVFKGIILKGLCPTGILCRTEGIMSGWEYVM